MHSRPLNKSLRMVHLAHRNHKIPIWKWSGSHLKNWLSPKNTTDKKNQNFKNPSSVSLGIP